MEALVGHVGLATVTKFEKPVAAQRPYNVKQNSTDIHLQSQEGTTSLNMMKSARKKLKKFWPRKKKRKTYYIDNTHHHCSRCSYSPYPSYAYPSAPPLPPNWAEFGLGYEDSSPQDHMPASNHQLEISESNQIEEEAGAADYLISSSPSYQQYMSSNPVFELPLSEKKVRAAGFFSCVFKVGTHFMRCFCPCLSIRD